ncbi:MAG TPA: RNA polymerase factor sigma-54 [Pirellulaceae bacterium]|nr:RNA polymerase factor sigma-54 [Pirellulaceae bacterium]
MRLSLGLEARQLQKQVLAPRMIQSMEILQLPMMALQERIEQELVENPTLEASESDPTLPDEVPDSSEAESPRDLDQRELVVDDKHNNADDFERLVNMDQDMPEAFEESIRKSASRMEEESDRKHDAMANIVSRPESLHDHLNHQLGELELDPDLQAMCERIISCLDPKDGGYLRVSLEDLLPADALPTALELAKKALTVVQNLDPVGIAARDLRECLLVQVTSDMPYAEELRAIIGHHLEDLRDNRLPQIEKATGYTIPRIKAAWEQLRKLNPKPGAGFAETIVQAVTPDVMVDRDEEGVYKVSLPDTRLPTLHISEHYRQRLSSGTATAEEKEFIKRKINAAQWLIESIEQRRSTLTKVSQAIVDHQKRFLDEGPEHIEPLKMQQIADKVHVHVTTVSRAVDDKWIQTPRGLFPLKRFFVGGTRSEDGDDVAWDIIRIKLQELIDKEDKKKPYSDDELVEALKTQGLTVARRTITKYRDKMNIPSSRQRRDWSGR